MANRLTAGRRNVFIALISNRTMHGVVVTVAVVMTATSVWAQESRGFLGAAFTASPWTVNPVNGGTPETTFTNGTVESSVVGAAAEFGWRFTPRNSVAVEMGVPERRDLTQTSSYFFGGPPSQPSRYRYRDMPILGLIRYRRPLDTRAHIELVGGFGVNRGSYRQLFSQSVEDEVTHMGVAATAGADVDIAASRHLSVVPQFRVLILPHGNVRDGANFASFGLNTVVYRFGVGLRVAF